MKAFYTKYKPWIIIAGIVLTLGLGAIIYFAVLKKGVKKGESNVLASLPNPTNDAPYSNDERMLIKSYADRLTSDLGHWYNKYLFTDDDLYTSLAVAEDRILIGCYEEYRADNGTDLIADMNGEQRWTWGGAGVSKTYDRLKALIQ